MHDKQRFPDSGRRFVLMALIGCLATAGCHSSPEPPSPHLPSAPGPSGVLVDTIAARRVGDRLTTTAAVTSVLALRAFVIGDADLPDRGLLVLGGPPGGVRESSLVTVSGVIDRFEFDRFADRYGLQDPRRYDRFTDHKIMLADDVHSWR